MMFGKYPSPHRFDSSVQVGRRLALALAVSITLHVAIGGFIHVPDSPLVVEPIQATLIAATEAPPEASPPKAEPPKPVPVKPHSRPRKVQKPSVLPDKPGTPPEPQLTTAGAPDDTLAAAAPAAEGGGGVEAVTTPSEVTTPSPADAPPLTPLRAERSLLPRGTIRYDLFYGSNHFLVGRSELRWNIEGGRYQLATSGKTIGIAALFYPFGVSSGSEGRITEGSFRPDFFFVDRTSRKGEKQLRVTFDWNAGIARFSGAEGEREAPLQPASLDLLSLICQLSVLKLEPGPLQLSLTNGRKLDTYEVVVGPEEVVDTPMGELRAVYVKQLRKPGDEGVELWLGVDFGYVPVRMRFTDRKGSIAGEQLVTDIQVVRG